MTDDKEVIFEIDLGGRRLNISAVDDDGYGDGYRITGPKFRDIDGGKPIVRHVLDARDVKEIRSYLTRWDEIQARSVASPSEEAQRG